MKYVLGFKPLAPLVREVKPLVKEVTLRGLSGKNNLLKCSQRLIIKPSPGRRCGGSLPKSNITSLDRTPVSSSCTSFSANQFWLFFHSATYVLFHAFRMIHLKGTEWASAQFDTIRLKIIKIGTRIIQRTRKIRVHLPTSFPWKEELQKIWISYCGPGYT